MMRKSLSLIISLVTVLLTGWMTMSNTVSADTVGDPATVDGGITLTATEPIALKSAPSFDFGTQTVSPTTMQFVAKNVDNSLTVVNPGYSSGWAVTLQVSSFVSSDGDKELSGAGIVMEPFDSNGSSAPYVASADSDDTTQQDDKPTAAYYPGKATNPGDAVVVFSAKEGKGVGTWSLKYNSDQVGIEIPVGATIGHYKADLTWSMTNAPTE